MPELERDIERALVGMVKRNGGLCLKWVCPGWVGVPDRMILLPGGRLIFVELKRPKGGHLREMQQWWSQKLQRLELGCDGVGSVILQLVDFLTEGLLLNRRFIA